MALQCPNCGTEIPAENINIQKMAALCGACSHVFQFSANAGTAQKYKRRKLKKPKRLNLEGEGDRLQLSYKRVFDQNGYGALAGLGFAAMVLTLGFVAVLFSPDAPKGVIVVPGAFMLPFWYIIAVLLTTVTRISADDESVAVNTGPLPFPNSEGTRLDTDEIVRVFCEETVDSKKGQSSIRYYRVNAELIDGSQVTLLSSLPQEYAFYIAQSLESRLHTADEIVASLSEDQAFDEAAPVDDPVQLAHLFDDEVTEFQRSD